MREGFVDTGAVRLCYFEHGRPDASRPTVLMLHATGFHARCWDAVIECLPETQHVIAVDMRGHGRSSKQPPYEWPAFAEDLRALIQQLDLQSIVGVGHSMGGHCQVQLASQHIGRFVSLLLVDPVILPPELYAAIGRHVFPNVEEHPVARRRNHWRDWQEMYARFENRHPYSLWQSRVLQDYCKYGVVQGDDGFELACPPVVEASIYMGTAETNVHALAASLSIPVTVLRATPREESDEGPMDFASSPTWPGLANSMQQGRDVYLPDLTHFMPMQDPQLIASYVVELLPG